MIIKALIVLVLLVCYHASHAQETRFNKRDSVRIIGVPHKWYNLDSSSKSNHPTKLPFGRVLFFDVRYDTSFIAISWQANQQFQLGANNQNTKFNLTGGLEKSLNNYVDRHFKTNYSNTDASVFCYIKKLHIGFKDTLLENSRPGESINKINLEVECYYKTGDTLYPALRIDTSYAESIGRLKKEFPELIQDLLKPLFEKLETIDPEKIKKRKAYQPAEIKERYQSRFNLPILTTKAYKRGVFRSFNEFINHAPSIREFTIKEEGTKVLLYDDQGQSISHVFGFSDGSDLWVFRGAYCAPLIRVGNGFEFFVTVYMVRRYATTTRKYLLALNMETGRVD
ncbi:hypothetical protein EXU57_14110 [Segetibacter sp. 3557_3]|uniref:hypothetical protein n=1 Tax=Segetibacter sp. 3557_3 TaxID=2547429 RepID=UPI001058E17B|nr:hypothetical protein [Segetibacter sp. 3557_3]TDH25235.1 hypothetical protein EXU57_14110 [Segetibacter sp. 3557_3]